MLCVLSRGTYSLRSTLNGKFFGKLFVAILFTLRVFVRNLLREEIAEGIILFGFLFWCRAWGSNPGFTSNKPTYYLLDYGDYMNAWMNISYCRDEIKFNYSRLPFCFPFSFLFFSSPSYATRNVVCDHWHPLHVCMYVCLKRISL